MVNLTPAAIVASLEVELTPFPGTRRVTLTLNGRSAAELLVPGGGRRCQVGPLPPLMPGDNILAFKPHDPAVEEPRAPRGRSRRPIALAVGAWRWRLPGEAAVGDSCGDGAARP